MQSDSRNIDDSSRIADDIVVQARTAYEEVLAATTHQDDKVGRLLTMSAFWTAGGAALLGFGSGAPIRSEYWIAGRSVGHVVAWLAVGYFTAIALASFLLLNSVMAPLVIPTGRSQRDGRSTTDGTHADRSLIYFFDIARDRQPESFFERWRVSRRPGSYSAEDMYLRETYNLARRAAHKYGRGNEATALLAFALLLFVCILVPSFASVSGRGQGAASQHHIVLSSSHLVSVGVLISAWCAVAVVHGARSTRLTVGGRNLLAMGWLTFGVISLYSVAEISLSLRWIPLISASCLLAAEVLLWRMPTIARGQPSHTPIDCAGRILHSLRTAAVVVGVVVLLFFNEAWPLVMLAPPTGLLLTMFFSSSVHDLCAARSARNTAGREDPLGQAADLAGDSEP